MTRQATPSPADLTALGATPDAEGDRALAERLDDDALLDTAVATAQLDARRGHLLLGRPVVVSRGGRSVEVWPSDPKAAALLSAEG